MAHHEWLPCQTSSILPGRGGRDVQAACRYAKFCQEYQERAAAALTMLGRALGAEGWWWLCALHMSPACLAWPASSAMPDERRKHNTGQNCRTSSRLPLPVPDRASSIQFCLGMCLGLKERKKTKRARRVAYRE